MLVAYMMGTALVATASSEATECSSGLCEGGSDASAFIQRHIQVKVSDMMPHLSPQSRQHESPEIRPAQVLQEEVEKMIRSGQEPSTTKIKDIEKLVSGEILPELQATHSMAQMDITMMSHAASATNQKTYQELQTTKHTMEVQVMHARDALSNCRTAEAPLNASKVLHCSVRDRFLQGIEVPSSLPSERSPALMGPYLDAMSTYFYPKHGEFVKLDTACINATSVYDVHRSSCNMMQAQYELDFCTWRTRMMDICMVASHVYAQAVATYRSKEASTKVLVQKMKTEYTAIKKILCYVNVWLSDSNTSTANQTILEACNMSAVDTSPMDISYPGVPCATTCDTSATAAHPGTEAFAAGYANYSQAPATITPCMAEGSPLATTPAPSALPSGDTTVNGTNGTCFIESYVYNQSSAPTPAPTPVPTPPPTQVATTTAGPTPATTPEAATTLTTTVGTTWVLAAVDNTCTAECSIRGFVCVESAFPETQQEFENIVDDMGICTKTIAAGPAYGAPVLQIVKNGIWEVGACRWLNCIGKNGEWNHAACTHPDYYNHLGYHYEHSFHNRCDSSANSPLHESHERRICPCKATNS